MQTGTIISEVRKAVGLARSAGDKVGCVPTMGALHAGHLSLIEKAASNSDFVVVTIFVNPTQFGPGEDYDSYPRTLENDLKLCEQAGANFVFHPQKETIYSDNPQLKLCVGELANRWEGDSRPGHFDGVATIVAKLFNIVQPDIAMFGKKDYQQLAIIKALCRDLNFPVEIDGCPIIREEDGLALSSRNAYLSPTERKQATILYQTLRLAEKLIQDDQLSLKQIRKQMLKMLLSESGVVPEYATIVDPNTLEMLEHRQQKMVALIAAKVGKTRLIDNCEIIRTTS